MKRTPLQWFNKWASIIKERKIVSRITLSELSGASVWTIKALQKDLLDWDAFIIYEDGRFISTLSISLSTNEELKNES